MKKLLIMGLPGSGKTTLASSLRQSLELKTTVEWINADIVRKIYDDWDFSREGRIRQSKRMRDLCMKSTCEFVICDFVAPLKEMRNIFHADYLIWMNTIPSGRFSDTNAIFEPPENYDLKIDAWNSADSVHQIISALMNRRWL